MCSLIDKLLCLGCGRISLGCSICKDTRDPNKIATSPLVCTSVSGWLLLSLFLFLFLFSIFVCREIAEEEEEEEEEREERVVASLLY